MTRRLGARCATCTSGSRHRGARRGWPAAGAGIVQGPYEPEVAGFHSKGWELGLERLEDYLAGARVKGVAR